MVQTIGIALGNDNCYVAACKDGGIEILLNNYSSRATPTMVAFGDHGRLIGVEASLNRVMNIKNTIYNIMRLVGSTYEEASTIELPFELGKTEDGTLCVNVMHQKEKKSFTIVQVLAMLLGKLKSIAGCTDCVLNCPQFYTAEQRAAIYQAAAIANLHPLDIITDMSAVALYYGYYRTTKKEEEPKLLAFVNFGASSLQTMIALINPKEDIIDVLAIDSEPNVGGRDFDALLAQHFIQTQNLQLTPRNKLRLTNECEKLKKQLSANCEEIPISIECLVSEEVDFYGRINRASFEKLGESLFKKIEGCLRRTIAAAESRYHEILARSASAPAPAPEAKLEEEEGIPIPIHVEGRDKPITPAPNAPTPQPSAAIPPQNPPQLFAVELVGGSSRIPAFKRIVKEVFGVEGSTTLNIDEAVARGCVLHCATLHPGVKVKRQILTREINPVQLDQQLLKVSKQLKDIELSLADCDREWKLRMDARNKLEEQVIELRSKGLLTKEVDEMEDWIYDNADECSKEQFFEKLHYLKTLLKADEKNNKAADDQADPADIALPATANPAEVVTDSTGDECNIQTQEQQEAENKAK